MASFSTLSGSRTASLHSWDPLINSTTIIEHLLRSRDPNRHWEYSNEQSNTNPPSRSLQSRGFHLVASGLLFRPFGIPCSGSPSDFCSQAHGTHTRTQMAHLCTRIHTLSRAHSHAHALPHFAAPPPMLTPAHARTTCTHTLWPPPPCSLPLTPSVSVQVPTV